MLVLGRPRAVVTAMAILVALGLVPAQTETRAAGLPERWAIDHDSGPDLQWQRRPVAGATGPYGWTLLIHPVRAERADGLVRRTLGFRIHDAGGHLVHEVPLTTALGAGGGGPRVRGDWRGFVITGPTGVRVKVSMDGVEHALRWRPGAAEAGPGDRLTFRDGSVSADGGRTWVELTSAR